MKIVWLFLASECFFFFVFVFQMLNYDEPRLVVGLLFSCLGSVKMIYCVTSLLSANLRKVSYVLLSHIASGSLSLFNTPEVPTYSFTVFVVYTLFSIS